jgi:hypothetical protein
MVFYHKGLRGRKTPLPFVACARKAAMLRGQIWSAHESDVVGLLPNLVLKPQPEVAEASKKTTTMPLPRRLR